MCWFLGLFPRVLRVVRTSALSVFLSPTVPVPEMEIKLETVLKIDTGGERWVLNPGDNQVTF